MNCHHPRPRSRPPPRSPGVVDPFRPRGFFLEKERAASGRAVSSACVLVASKECPWRCLMCDLWKHTFKMPTAVGAIPLQLDFAFARLGRTAAQVKLYNSGSFFDVAAVPPADYASIAARVSFASNVVVESHPRLVGQRSIRFRDLLAGSLEVAMGLETVHPEALPRLNKRASLADFARAAEFLRSNQISLRAFVLVKPPFTTEPEAIEWAVRSAQFAFDCGASAVSLIPTRPGNAPLDALIAKGEFAPPRLEMLEAALEAVVGLKRGRAFADTWDLEQFSVCPACLPGRKRRLEKTNLTQELQPPATCHLCGHGLRPKP